MTRMRHWMLAGVLVVGMGGAACEVPIPGAPTPPPGVEAEARTGEQLETSAPAGTTVEPGERPQMGEVQKLESQRRERYEDIAEDVGVEPWPDERRAPVPEDESATGGGGAAGADERPAPHGR